MIVKLGGEFHAIVQSIFVSRSGR